MMGPGIAGTLALGGVRATILSRTEEGARKGPSIMPGGPDAFTKLVGEMGVRAYLGPGFRDPVEAFRLHPGP